MIAYSLSARKQNLHAVVAEFYFFSFSQKQIKKVKGFGPLYKFLGAYLQNICLHSKLEQPMRHTVPKPRGTSFPPKRGCRH